jgi:hypothetical protein
MNKPGSMIFKIAELGWIQGLFIQYVQVGVDRAETHCKITGRNGSCDGDWRTYKRYLDVGVGHNYVAKLKPEYDDQLREWRIFEKNNTKELAEYERLKNKFKT